MFLAFSRRQEDRLNGCACHNYFLCFHSQTSGKFRWSEIHFLTQLKRRGVVRHQLLDVVVGEVETEDQISQHAIVPVLESIDLHFDCLIFSNLLAITK